MTPGNTLTISRSRQRLVIWLLILLALIAPGVQFFASIAAQNVPFVWKYWRNHINVEPSIAAKRDELLQQAHSEIIKEFYKLSERYPQLNAGYLNVNFGQPESLGFFRKENPDHCRVMLRIHPYTWNGFWGYNADEPMIFPNLNLKGRVIIFGGADSLVYGPADPDADPALKQMVAKALKPLRDLDASSGPLKAPMDVDDLHWNVLTTTAPAATQP